MGSNRRDVEIAGLPGGNCLVVACDSCGAVGEKELDAVSAPAYVVGRYTARVALFEVLAVGAAPAAASVTVSSEPSPTGEEILRGVRDELGALDGQALPIAVSTEKNMPTRQTAAGVTVMGVCRREGLRLALSQPGDAVYCLGVPRVGAEVAGPDDDASVRLRHLQALLACRGVHDVIPVGSKGIGWEAETLAGMAGRLLTLEAGPGLDLQKSAGPGTCVVFSCLPGAELPGFDGMALTKVGTLL